MHIQLIVTPEGRLLAVLFFFDSYSFLHVTRIFFIYYKINDDTANIFVVSSTYYLGSEDNWNFVLLKKQDIIHKIYLI